MLFCTISWIACRVKELVVKVSLFFYFLMLFHLCVLVVLLIIGWSSRSKIVLGIDAVGHRMLVLAFTSTSSSSEIRTASPSTVRVVVK